MIPDEKYLVCYFGRQSNYYLEIYKDYHSGKKFNVNIGAFFTGFFWFLYRKLFLHALIIFCSIFLMGILEQTIYETFWVNPEVQQIVYVIENCTIAFTLGFTGNSFYIRKADKEIHQILASTTNEEERMMLLKHKGGISWIPFVLLGLIILFYISQ